MSLAAWMPSSFKFFSICLLLALEALSSADIAHPMMVFKLILKFSEEPTLPAALVPRGHHLIDQVVPRDSNYNNNNDDVNNDDDED